MHRLHPPPSPCTPSPLLLPSLHPFYPLPAPLLPSCSSSQRLHPCPVCPRVCMVSMCEAAPEAQIQGRDGPQRVAQAGQRRGCRRVSRGDRPPAAAWWRPAAPRPAPPSLCHHSSRTSPWPSTTSSARSLKGRLCRATGKALPRVPRAPGRDLALLSPGCHAPGRRVTRSLVSQGRELGHPGDLHGGAGLLDPPVPRHVPRQQLPEVHRLDAVRQGARAAVASPSVRSPVSWGGSLRCRPWARWRVWAVGSPVLGRPADVALRRACPPQRITERPCPQVTPACVPVARPVPVHPPAASSVLTRPDTGPPPWPSTAQL